MLKFRSKTTRTLLSILVRFFLRLPGRPSRPSMGVEIEDGLGSMLSTAMVSVIERWRTDMKAQSSTDRPVAEESLLFYAQQNSNKKILYSFN